MDVKTITIRMYTCFLAYLISAFFKCFVSAEGVYRWYYQYRGIDISKRFVPLLVLAVIHQASSLKGRCNMKEKRTIKVSILIVTILFLAGSIMFLNIRKEKKQKYFSEAIDDSQVNLVLENKAGIEYEIVEISITQEETGKGLKKQVEDHVQIEMKKEDGVHNYVNLPIRHTHPFAVELQELKPGDRIIFHMEYVTGLPTFDKVETESPVQ